MERRYTTCNHTSTQRYVDFCEFEQGRAWFTENLKYEVQVHYRRRSEINADGFYEWIDGNTTGYWSRIQERSSVRFLFEKHDDALKFKKNHVDYYATEVDECSDEDLELPDVDDVDEDDIPSEEETVEITEEEPRLAVNDLVELPYPAQIHWSSPNIFRRRPMSFHEVPITFSFLQDQPPEADVEMNAAEAAPAPTAEEDVDDGVANALTTIEERMVETAINDSYRRVEITQEDRERILEMLYDMNRAFDGNNS